MMYEKLMKKLEKGKGKEMSDVHRDAKMAVVKALRDDASSSLMGKLKGLKKVSVMSDSKEGLKEGLEKAEELVGESEMEKEESPEMVTEEDEEIGEEKEFEMMDDAQIEELMAKLMEIKQKDRRK